MGRMDSEKEPVNSEKEPVKPLPVNPPQIEACLSNLEIFIKSLSNIQAEEQMSEETKKVLNLKQKDLLSIPGTMFGAGFATITITTKWAILLLAKYPEVQVRML